MEWEFDVLYWFQQLHHPLLDKIVVAVTSLGNSGIFWILLTVVMLIACKQKKAAWTSAVALLLSLLVCNILLKNLVARDRPCWIDPSVELLVKMPEDFSFPSGHSSASFASAVSVFLYYRKPGAAALILAGCIALTRLYLFVHFPTDVLIGTVLGILEALTAYVIVQAVYQRMQKKLSEKKSN